MGEHSSGLAKKIKGKKERFLRANSVAVTAPSRVLHGV
jgi:hypothetical protein